MSHDISLEMFAEILRQIEDERDAELVLTKRGLSRATWENAKLAYAKAIGVDGPERARFLGAYLRPETAKVTEDGSPAPVSDQPESVDTAPRKQELPTYIQVQAAQSLDLDPDATLPIALGAIPSAPLPFTGETSSADLAALKAANARVEVEPPDSNVEETLMLLSPLTTQAGSANSFREKISPVAIPILSVDEYAILRAKLAVRGEDDTETWKEFGIMSAAAKGMLQARFVEYFRRDPEAQRQFVERLKALKSET